MDHMKHGRIVLLEGIHPSAETRLEKTGMEIVRVDGSLGKGDLESVLHEATMVGIRSRTQLDDELIRKVPNLQAIGCFCIGTNQVDLEAAAGLGIPVFNAPFSNTRSVAELTLAEIVMLMRRIPQRSADMHSGKWRKSAAGSREVRGRTLGIVGYGHIGSQLSILAEAIGMKVIYHDHISKLPLGNAHPARDLEELLSTADVVSLHVPATPATRNMIDAGRLAMMKPEALLINNSRGNVVEIDSLVSALKNGRLGGAAIDVFPEEPRSGDSAFETPLAGLENVLLTPHIGGNTLEAQASIADEVGEKMVRFACEGSTGTAVNLPTVDLPSRGSGQHRILHFHRNVPGVLGSMHSALAGLGVNINAEYLRSQDDLSYVILDVDPADEGAIRSELEKIPETIRMRIIVD
ncbi:MAG: phosphoglycerate dehydrogenase [Phycisphaerae bacterium]|nr:phosphoglycerate dehydrogenase [Phycisphaerae bacterium]